jgi:hypothetical protein
MLPDQISKKLAYLQKKSELERLLKKYESGSKEHDDEKWYLVYVDWCFLTESSNNIYC